MARATTSRGASSASGCCPTMKRSPVSSTSTAPSPRSASVSRAMGSRPLARAVGWNCTNSRSARRAPARAAMARPSPVTSGGLVVLAYRRPMPPVASTTAGARASSSLPGVGAPRHPDHPAPVHHQVGREGEGEGLDVVGGRGGPDQRPHHLGPGGVAPGVQHPPPVVASLPAQQQAAVGAGVEVHPDGLQGGHPLRGGGGQHLHRLAGRSGPRPPPPCRRRAPGESRRPPPRRRSRPGPRGWTRRRGRPW